jgi:cobalt-zinc-cadmium efflux system outer membrane protein
MKIPRQKIVALLTIIFITGHAAHTQTTTDTLKISLPDAEKTFLQKNFSLLAAKYNIDVNKALIRQAKLWDNPLLSTDQNVYDNQGGFFKHDNNNGQFYAQVMQLIKTAGKRSKAAQLATDNTTLSQEQFDDIVRTLRYTLRSDLLEVSHYLKIKKVYDGEITEVNKLVTGMDLQLQAGNSSVKDNLRIKALLFSLQNELVNVNAQLMPVENEIRLLLNSTEKKFIAPQLEYKFGELTTVTIPSAEDLIKQAVTLRPDAKMAQTQLQFQQHNLVYQKAMAKPDVSLGLEFDQHSSYAPNYVGLAIALPLNILNHNQGNIASAKFAIQEQKVVTDQTLFRIGNDITAAVDKLSFYKNVNNLQQLDFSKQYDALFTNMLKSYQERQMSLLEFIDFMDAYKDNKLKLIEQHNGLIHAIEDLNFAVNDTVIKLN